ncbi:VWA domain-containing protein [Nitratireductor kimnyeongensis]|uniref:VWA domain-containing protein n=1 Tax=Nitratireductor kimnyeongensis TaxID=430679 RepID=A0ABW0T4G7_9HYPH|nr:VWA domain-containing protein [Nitratireductor kimnyeongensis]QZZ34936.1 VWA domain-containing protein [Nitratireductor kimnyeongensis]
MIRTRLLSVLAALLFALPAMATGKTIIVLDGSGSMWGQIDGTTKIEIARQTLREVMDRLPQDTELGLVAYGHREKGSCSDIEIAIPPATGTAGAVADFADSLNPKGKTPLTDAVRKAAEELRIEENAATVILVTDGLETCDADPCALGRELEASGVDFTAHVVGFGLSDEEGQEVACLAENTGGLYLKADDAGQLAEALQTTVAKAPESEPEPKPEPAPVEFNVRGIARLSQDGPDMAESSEVRWDFVPLGENGQPADRSAAGGYRGMFAASVPPGKYRAKARLGRIDFETDVELTADATTDVVAVLDAGLVEITPKRTPEDTDADQSARVDVHFDGTKDGGYGQTRVWAKAGTIKVTGRIAQATAEEDHQLVAGETLTLDLIIGSGLVVPTAIYTEGGPEVEGNAIRFEVLEAKADINGNRKTLAGQYGPGKQGMDVPPGDYMLHARLGKAEAMTPISVKAGERIEPIVNINAGVLAVSAPGAYRIDFLEGKKDLQGNQKNLSGSYDVEAQETFHPGEYEVRVRYEGDRAEESRKATVAAGERTEVVIE